MRRTALVLGELAGDAAGLAARHVDEEPAGQAHLAGETGALLADRVLGGLHEHRLAGRQRVLDLALLAVAQRAPVDLAGVEHGVAAGADVDERGLHARQDVLDLAEVDVADHRRLRLARDVVLDEDGVLEDGDLGVVVALAHDHLALDRLAAGQELGLGHDRGTTAAGLAALAAPLLLRLEPRGSADAGDLVLGAAALAHLDHGVLGVVGRAGRVLAGAGAAAAPTGGVAVAVPSSESSSSASSESSPSSRRRRPCDDDVRRGCGGGAWVRRRRRHRRRRDRRGVVRRPASAAPAGWWSRAAGT